MVHFQLVLALCLTFTVVMVTGADNPKPGTICNSGADCAMDTSSMTCVKGNAGSARCVCEDFRATIYAVTSPTFNTTLNKCVVKANDTCLLPKQGLVPPAMDCEPTYSCQVKPNETEIGTCKIDTSKNLARSNYAGTVTTMIIVSTMMALV